MSFCWKKKSFSSWPQLNYFIVHLAFSPPRRGLFSCTVKSWFGKLFNDFFFPKMFLWDSSQHAKTGEVLQQAVLVKRCLASCTVLHSSNYSLLLFCQLQWISCSLYWRCLFSSTKLWNCADLFFWSFSIQFQIKLTAIGIQEQLLPFVYL